MLTTLWTRRRLAAAERAAVEASVDDPSFEPQHVIEAAGRLIGPVLGRRRASEIAPVKQLFGEFDATVAGWKEERPPEKTHVLVDRPRLRIAMLDRDRDAHVVRVTLLAQARACVWTGPFGYRVTRVFGASLTGSTGLAYPHRLTAYWAFEHEGRRWRFDETAERWWVEHRLRTDPSGEATLAERLHEETVVELAEVPADTIVPYEIATNLPDDPDDALRDLAMVDERFDRNVLESAIRTLHDRLDPLEGLRVKAVKVTRIRALRMPCEIEVELRIRAPGGWGARRETKAWWRLAATSSRTEPWRLVDANVDPFGLQRRPPPGP